MKLEKYLVIQRKKNERTSKRKKPLQGPERALADLFPMQGPEGQADRRPEQAASRRAFDEDQGRHSPRSL